MSKPTFFCNDVSDIFIEDMKILDNDLQVLIGYNFKQNNILNQGKN